MYIGIYIYMYIYIYTSILPVFRPGRTLQISRGLILYRSFEFDARNSDPRSRCYYLKGVWLAFLNTHKLGRPSPLRPWCISPLFQIPPPIFEKCSDSVENFQNLTFSRKISWFSSPKVSYDLFLVSDHKCRISPLFSLFQYSSPCFAKIIISPLLWQIPPLF